MKKCNEQGVPTIDEARLLLKEAEDLFPGPWVQHHFGLLKQLS